MEFEKSLKKTFHSSVLNLLESKSLIPPSSLATLLQDKLITCEQATGQEGKEPSNSYASYRAKLFGTQHFSSDSLIRIIEAWRLLGVILEVDDETARHDRSELSIELSKDCPVEIELLSTPLCTVEQSKSNTSALQHVDGSKVVSLPIMVISLVVEFVVLLVVFLSISLLLSRLMAKRQKR